MVTKLQARSVKTGETFDFWAWAYSDNDSVVGLITAQGDAFPPSDIHSWLFGGVGEVVISGAATAIVEAVERMIHA